MPVEGRGATTGEPSPQEVLLFADDGQLSYLELVWYGESPPVSRPGLNDLDLVEVDW